MENGMKTKQNTFEKIVATYLEDGGNPFPDEYFPDQKEIGKYGLLHLDFMEKKQRGKLNGLTGRGELNAYLYEIDTQAYDMLFALIEKLSKAQGIDEHLKATDQMRWVQMMNNIRSSAEETIMRELILA
jgi:hypothetical protein